MVAEPTVVVVDDDDAVRDSLQAMLEAEGFAVETFAAAADFLEGYRPASNSCLVIDVRMPGMDGIELLTKLATRVSSPPVIMMTGHGDVPMAVMAMKLGAVDFVEKPFAAATLVRSIRDALATCRPPRPRPTRSMVAWRAHRARARRASSSWWSVGPTRRSPWNSISRARWRSTAHA